MGKITSGGRQGKIQGTSLFDHRTLKGPSSQTLLVVTIEGTFELGWGTLVATIIFNFRLYGPIRF